MRQATTTLASVFACGLAFAGEVLRVHPELATRYCAGETPAAELIHEPVSAANAESGDEALLEVLKQ